MTGKAEGSIGVDWPLRPWLYAAMLGLSGWVVWLVSDNFDYDLVPWRAALTALVFFGALSFVFVFETERRNEALGFAAAVGLVLGGIAWRVASADRYYDSSSFWLAAGILASVLAIPLFQARFHRLRWNTSYSETHFHVWTDAITAGGAFAFLGLSWLVANLLAELFLTIKIEFLRDLLQESWFGWVFSGVAFGAALGVLRNQLKIIGTLQNVVLLVFSLIAVPLAFALVLFLAAVLFSGLDVLWEATRSATPLLLALAAGSFVLVNSVLRDSDETSSGSRVMRSAALVLSLGILPLSIMASISMGTRIAQYGLSPERIWALIAIIVAVAFGVAYFVAAIRSLRHGWDKLREANMRLALATSVLALLLAMPILDFGMLSAKNQVARLEAGKVSAEEFDYDALRWDFGEGGRRELARLVQNDDAQVAELASEALKSTSRPNRWHRERADQRRERQQNVRIDIEDKALEKAARRYIASSGYMCKLPCVVLDPKRPEKDGSRWIFVVENGNVFKHLVSMKPDAGDGEGAVAAVEVENATNDKPVEQTTESIVEIREWTGRRVYVDGQPIGDPFE